MAGDTLISRFSRSLNYFSTMVVMAAYQATATTKSAVYQAGDVAKNNSWDIPLGYRGIRNVQVESILYGIRCLNG